MATPQTNGSVDLSQLYSNYQRTASWRDSLGKKLAHKALDIAEDDLNINANKTGVGGMALMGTAGIVAAAVLGAAYMFKPAPVTQPTVPQPQVTNPVPSTPPVAPTTIFPFVYDAVEYDPATGKDTGNKVRMRLNKDGSVDQKQPDGTWKQTSPPTMKDNSSAPLTFTPNG